MCEAMAAPAVGPNPGKILTTPGGNPACQNNMRGNKLKRRWLQSQAKPQAVWGNPDPAQHPYKHRAEGASKKKKMFTDGQFPKRGEARKDTGKDKGCGYLDLNNIWWFHQIVLSCLATNMFISITHCFSDTFGRREAIICLYTSQNIVFSRDSTFIQLKLFSFKVNLTFFRFSVYT